MENQKRPFWTRDSSILLGGFFVTIFLIVYIWWPLAEEYLAYVDWDGKWWLYMDWLLLGVFMFMTVTIVARANLKTDVLIVFVGIFVAFSVYACACRQGRHRARRECTLRCYVFFFAVSACSW